MTPNLPTVRYSIGQRVNVAFHWGSGLGYRGPARIIGGVVRNGWGWLVELEAVGRQQVFVGEWEMSP